MQTEIGQEELKSLFKAAIVEVLEERRDLLRDVIDEALEDVALARAIEEGNASEAASRAEVFAILEDAA